MSCCFLVRVTYHEDNVISTSTVSTVKRQYKLQYWKGKRVARLFRGVSLFPLDCRQTIAGNGVNREINYQNSGSNFNNLSAAYCLS